MSDFQKTTSCERKNFFAMFEKFSGFHSFFRKVKKSKSLKYCFFFTQTYSGNTVYVVCLPYKSHMQVVTIETKDIRYTTDTQPPQHLLTKTESVLCWISLVNFLM